MFCAAMRFFQPVLLRKETQLTDSTPDSGPLALTELVAAAIRHLEQLRYAPITVTQYSRMWRSFLRFAAKAGAEDFSEDLAERFLASKGIALAGPTASSRDHLLRALMWMLSTFSRDGCFHRRRHIPERVPLTGEMSTALDEYEKFRVERFQTSPLTIRSCRRTLTLFLHFVGSRGVEGPAGIRASDISAFVRSRGHLEPGTVAIETYALRSFLRIGFVLGFIPVEMTAHVPKVRVRKHGRIPTAWTSADVEAVLNAVDRESPTGKRDFAILLLACRLGVRVGDIRALKLDALHWQRRCIFFRQGKTGVALELPLDDEIAEALIDYLRNGRPPTECREVFVRAVAPFVPFSATDNLGAILDKYRQLAGVALPARSRRGLHSLRHSLASQLLSSGVPLEQIGSILGHQSLDATRVYTSIDIDALRTAALNVDEDCHA
jgi:site-specific recombinase XerD